MVEKIKKLGKAIIKRIIKPKQKKLAKEKTKTLISFKEELSEFPENNEKFSITRRRKLRNLLCTHDELGKALKVKRRVENCYNRRDLCPREREKKTGCGDHKKVLGYDYCYYYCPK